MKTKLKGKILAILMSLAMVFTMMPMMGGAVYADDPIYTITIDPGLGTGTAFTKTSRIILTEEDIEDGHYDNTGGSFFIRESTGKIEYKFPDTCDFEAPSKTKFDGWNDGIRDWAWEPGQELELSRLFNGTTSNSMTITAHYKDISCGENLDWNRRWPNKDGLNIYGSGAMYDFTDPNSDKPAPWYDERDHIKGIAFYDAVTNIGDYAFAYLDLIWSNSLPQEIPSSVTKIGNYAFAYSNLYKIRIGTPSSLTSIGDYAFAYTKLDYKGDSRLVIPSPVTSIGRNAFQSTYDLENISIPSSVESIGDGAFVFSGLRSVNFENGSKLKTIGFEAFKGCDNLVEITLPDGVETIGESAFCGLENLQEITIPASVKSIGNEAFIHSNKLKTINYGGTKKQWEDLTKHVQRMYSSGAEVEVLYPNYTKTIAEPVVAQPLTYNGEEQTGVPAGEGYTLSGTAKATKAGTYTAKATLRTDTDYVYKWSDGTTDPKTIEWTIDRATAKVTEPEGKSLTYNGEEQTGVAEGTGYILSGKTKATDAGTYKAEATLVTNDPNYVYEWENGETGLRTIDWEIKKAVAEDKVAIPEGKDDLIYSGEEQTGVDEGTGYILTGETKATKAGTYTAKATLNTDDNYIYKWSDGTTAPKNITWKINKATAKVTEPATKTFTYNGKEQVYAMDGANYTLSGTTKATKAGTYTANATLNDDDNYIYKWSDGTTAVKSITWKINKAANPLKIKAKTATVKGSTKGKNGKLKKTKTLGVTKVIAFTKKGQGKMTYTKASGNKKITIAKTTGKVTVKKGLKKGTYKVKVKVKAAGNANYKASAVKTVTFKVKVK